MDKNCFDVIPYFSYMLPELCKTLIGSLYYWREPIFFTQFAKQKVSQILYIIVF